MKVAYYPGNVARGAMMEVEMSKVNLDWVELMPDIVKALNEVPTEALRGRAPEDIVGDEAGGRLNTRNTCVLKTNSKSKGRTEGIARGLYTSHLSRIRKIRL